MAGAWTQRDAEPTPVPTELLRAINGHACATSAAAGASAPMPPPLAPTASASPPAPAAAPTPVAVVGSMTQFKTPKNAVLTIAKAGIAKADLPLHHAFFLALYGGAYVAMGATVSVVVAGGLTTPDVDAGVVGVAMHGTSSPINGADGTSADAAASAVTLTLAVPAAVVKLASAAVFPIGLMLIVVCGAELFTGNVMYLTMALYGGKTTPRKALLNLCAVYAGNLIGTVLYAYVFAYLTDTVTEDPWRSYIQRLALAKVQPHWGRLLLRGVACNVLVAMGMWFAIAAEDLPGKLVGGWVPIFLFAACGYEHCVANMFFVPVALMLPWTPATHAPFTVADFITRNLIPVTVGNIFGAAVCVTAFYFWIFQPHMALALEAMQTAPGVPKHIKAAQQHHALAALHEHAHIHTYRRAASDADRPAAARA